MTSGCFAELSVVTGHNIKYIRILDGCTDKVPGVGAAGSQGHASNSKESIKLLSESNVMLCDIQLGIPVALKASHPPPSCLPLPPSPPPSPPPPSTPLPQTHHLYFSTAVLSLPPLPVLQHYSHIILWDDHGKTTIQFTSVIFSTGLLHV